MAIRAALRRRSGRALRWWQQGVRINRATATTTDGRDAAAGWRFCGSWGSWGAGRPCWVAATAASTIDAYVAGCFLLPLALMQRMWTPEDALSAAIAVRSALASLPYALRFFVRAHLALNCAASKNGRVSTLFRNVNKRRRHRPHGAETGHGMQTHHRSADRARRLTRAHADAVRVQARGCGFMQEPHETCRTVNAAYGRRVASQYR